MLKKMCPKNFIAPEYLASANTPKTRQSGVVAALSYTPPTLVEGKLAWYIAFYAYDPEIGKMKLKRIKINRIKGIAKKRKYAKDVIKRLTYQLEHGWNPWIARDTSNLVVFEDAMSRYETHIQKMLESGYFRKETYDGYKSNVKIMREYMQTKRPIYYAYQFDRNFCVDFLDYIFLDRNNGAQTRNNYLNFLRVFSSFLVEKGIILTKPTDGIQPISKRLYQKERDIIPLAVVRRIADYCKENDPNFLFACYLLYYCFIRPVEMTRLRIKDFNLKDCTVTIPGAASKNKKTQNVTMPKKVLHYGIELGIFNHPMTSLVFSTHLRPGTEQINPKKFRDHWEKLRKALRLKKEWKFYSLKDTGITALCDNGMASIAIRDQARHSSLAITDIYTRHNAPANPDIVNSDGAL